METENWIENYNKLNNSFSKTLVFRVGIESGFFSEINHLIMAVLFCLQNKIRFVLSSKENNFAYQKGWDDYFLPFCEESQDNLHLKYNARSHQIRTTIPNLIKLKLIRRYLKIDYLTQDIWPYIKDSKFHNETFKFPSLTIDGDFLSAMHILAKNIWRYQPEINTIINTKLADLNLLVPYVGMHIRSGDIEKKNYAISSYINLTKSLSSNKTLFVATDNYSSVATINQNFAEYKVYTFCAETESGFSEGAYNSQNKETKRETLIALLTDTEALYRSEIFVGTLSSNVGTFVGMRRNANQWFGIDANEWRIF
ncbi:MAG: hypothetical protein EOP42_18180 [Sphingobacteriaceae bacterium]|nr:MAG: hypothetical protein EOP42_18180 [Sphingobacteriaceae bacterium]